MAAPGEVEIDKMAALFESYYGMGDEKAEEENTRNVDSVAFNAEEFVRGAGRRRRGARGVVSRLRARVGSGCEPRAGSATRGGRSRGGREWRALARRGGVQRRAAWVHARAHTGRPRCRYPANARRAPVQQLLVGGPWPGSMREIWCDLV